MSTLLLIDDDDGLRLMLEELFTMEGFRVLTASDGEQGLRIARAHHPDIILSDVRMPGTNGHEALIEFRRTPGLDAIPVILMTGEADLPDMRKSMELGADDYLPKPIEHGRLLSVIRQHLERSAHRREAASAELRALRRNLGALLPADMVDPLHEIIGCASVLEVDANMMPPDDIRDFAGNILKAADTLNRRLENFILFSSLEAGTFPIPRGSSTAIDTIARHTTEQVARRHNRVDYLRFDLVPVTASVPRDLFAKIIAELVDNACRYSIKTEPIDVKLSASDDRFVLKIADYGMGIPPDRLEAIENPNSTKSGVGLTLSRRLTELLGGTWLLDNRPKRGLSISLAFPLPR